MEHKHNFRYKDSDQPRWLRRPTSTMDLERIPTSSATLRFGLQREHGDPRSGQPLGLPGLKDFRTSSKCTKAFPLKTYKVTLSFRNDADKHDDDWLVKYLKRYTSHAYAVAEHGESGKRHLHAAMCFTDARLRDHVRDSFANYVKARNSRHPDALSEPRVAVVVNAMHDHKWYEEYLNKEDDKEVIYDNYDSDAVGEHFPCADIQRELQAIRDINRSGDPRFGKLHSDFLEWYKGDLRSVCWDDTFEFLNDLMFKSKTHRVIVDPRKVQQMALALYRYVTGDLRKLEHDKRFKADIFG